MRPGGNPLDLNNLPDDQHSRDGKQVLDNSSSPGYNKKESGEDDGKEECGKVYECRFCSLKFCKSQALGGHMNRHRQEKETEKLNHARRLVFLKDHNLAAQGALHLGCCQPMASASASGGYHPAVNMGDPITVPLTFPTSSSLSASSSSSTHIPPQQPSQPCVYASPSQPTVSNFPTHNFSQQYPRNDYHHAGHVMGTISQQQYYVASGAAAAAYDSSYSTNYTCIGAPVGHGSLHNQEDQGLMNWGIRSYSSGAQHRLEYPPSTINRFQDGF